MIACIGAAHVDRRGILHGPLILGTSNPGDVHLDLGGVARNVAENLARLGCQVSMLSRVGDDEDGRRVLAHLQAAGIDTTMVSVSSGRPTASYTAILESGGELVLGLADMGIYDEIDCRDAGRRPPAPASASSTGSSMPTSPAPRSTGCWRSRARSMLPWTRSRW